MILLFFIKLLIVIFGLVSVQTNAWAIDLYLSENFKITPEVILREVYSDNIYLTDTDAEEDFVTSVLPGVDMQLAFTPRSRLEFVYLGEFDFYKNANNFKKDHHYGDLNFEYNTTKGSSFTIGAWGDDSANQPYAPDDRSKDYDIKAFYTDFSLKLFSATDFFGMYQHSSRRYDDPIDRNDNYDRDLVTAGVVNSRSSLFPLLLEYRYERQENDDSTVGATDFVYQAAYTGFKWRQDRRLSGNLRIGYLWSKYNSTEAFDGWATDTDLEYALTAFTRILGTAYRGVRESTRSARETLDYYVYLGGSVSITYTRLDPFRIVIDGRWENKDYRSVNIAAPRREDDLYRIGVTTRYRLKDWFSIALGYRYQKNDSNLEVESYNENLVFAELNFLSGGNLRRKRLPRTIEQIDYFKP